MEEQLISFETANLAKEKGYNITNYLSYDENTGTMLPKDPAYPGWHCYALDGACPAPAQSLLQKWLRENYKIIVSINIMSDLSYYSLLIDINENKLNLKNQSKNRGFSTYEEALEDGLLRALKSIKSV